MSPNEYQVLAHRTAKNFKHLATDLTHAALGIATEGGEFTTEVKRAAIYDKEITPEVKAHMLEELGDLMWYVALACTHLDTNLETVLEANILKLKVRFPNAYSNEAAEGRADKGGADARSS